MGQNENRALDAQLCAFAPLKAQTLPDKAFFEYKAMDTGVRVLENGDVYIGYYSFARSPAATSAPARAPAPSAS